MRIDRLRVKNFRGFAEREFVFPGDPATGSFHIVIGENASGKTSLLEGLSVALGSYTVEWPDGNSRYIAPHDIRQSLDTIEGQRRVTPQLPVEVQAEGHLEGQVVKWLRKRVNKRSSDNGGLSKATRKLQEQSQKDPYHVLPLVGYFGAARLYGQLNDTWSSDRHGTKTTLKPSAIQDAPGLSAFEEKALFRSKAAGYWYANDSRTNPRLLQLWLRLEASNAFSTGQPTAAYELVLDAIKTCVWDCTDVVFDGRLGLLLAIKGHGLLPFDRLSDGQRNVASIVGDLAWKAGQLNPGLGRDALTKTPGIVLVDELDMHLHPNWQRRIVDDLRRLFPRVQFIATTHSPFVVQTAREGELIPLDLEALQQVSNLGVASISKGLMGVEEVSERFMGVAEPDASPRYNKMKQVATDYLIELQEAKKAPAEKLEEYKRALAERIAPYADNPAFQAVLEMERITALGS